MRKELFVLFGIFLLLFSSCKKEDENLFDQTADERKATAIANLKAKLTAPASGWRVKYRPNPETGSFYVLLNFSEDNKVHMRTDLSTNDGEFFDKTVPYRIDSSLGLELIFETYSFFSFLFDQGAADLEGEFEFNYVNETPEGALVFSSRTDRTGPTTMVMEPAGANDTSLLATTLSGHLQTLSDDLSKYNTSIRIDYENKDRSIYVSIDDFRRTITFNYIGLKSSVLSGESLNFTSRFILEENSIVLDEPFNLNFQGSAISIDAIELGGTFSESTIDVCTDPLVVSSFTGTIPSSGDAISFGTTLFDPNGAKIFERSDYFFGPLQYVLKDGRGFGREIATNIAGAVEIHLIYNLELNDGTILTAIGFVILNEDNTATFALKEFEETIVDNKIAFTFKPGIRLLGNTEVEVNTEKIEEYIALLTEGDNTFIFRLNEDVYEFYNPCNAFNIVFIAND